MTPEEQRKANRIFVITVIITIAIVVALIFKVRG